MFKHVRATRALLGTEAVHLTVPLLGGIDAELGVFDPQAQPIPETTNYAEAR